MFSEAKVLLRTLTTQEILLHTCHRKHKLVNEYNTVLSDFLEKHGPLCKRSITDRPHTPMVQ